MGNVGDPQWPKPYKSLAGRQRKHFMSVEWIPQPFKPGKHSGAEPSSFCWNPLKTFPTFPRNPIRVGIHLVFHSSWARALQVPGGNTSWVLGSTGNILRCKLTLMKIHQLQSYSVGIHGRGIEENILQLLRGTRRALAQDE